MIYMKFKLLHINLWDKSIGRQVLKFLNSCNLAPVCLLIRIDTLTSVYEHFPNIGLSVIIPSLWEKELGRFVDLPAWGGEDFWCCGACI